MVAAARRAAPIRETDERLLADPRVPVVAQAARATRAKVSGRSAPPECADAKAMARPIPGGKSWATLALALAAVAPRAARADESSLIRYRAPATCPDGNAFIERVRSRTPHVELAREGAAARFVVTVSSTGEESVGRVEFAREENVARDVAGKTCDEVVSAAALITALAIEATESDPVPATPPPASVVSRTEQASEASTGAPARRPFGWGAGATVGFDGWSAPGGAYAFGSFGEVSGPTPLRLARIGLRGAIGSTSIDERAAAFLLLAGRMTLCPVSLELATHLELLPCAGFEVGRLGGRGERSAALPQAGAAAILWSAAQAEVLIRWHTLPVVALEIGGELGFPLVRHNFIFEGPTQVIYEVPAMGAGIHVGVALHFR
jgi:hypothetical protein